MKSLRIAQVAPPYESVPPRMYGGTERVVHWLTEELVRRGHDVTLFASGDSTTTARLVPTCQQALRLNPRILDPHAYVMRALGKVFERSDQFDIIHCHLDYFHLPFIRLIKTPVVATLHGRLDLPDLPAIIEDYPEAHWISISNSQRKPLARANWQGTVYHGLPLEKYKVGAGDGDYLTFLGRLSPEKGAEVAIAVARTVGIPLRIAAKVDPADRAYFEAKIKPLLAQPGIEYCGEIDDRQKSEFLGRAKALLFPINWPEPFGITMIEALACGTPVIAFNHGSVPEILAHRRTGFICSSTEEMVAAVRQIGMIDRRHCRQNVEQNFSSQVMADNYEAVFQRILSFEDLPRLSNRGRTFANILSLRTSEKLMENT